MLILISAPRQAQTTAPSQVIAMIPKTDISSGHRIALSNRYRLTMFHSPSPINSKSTAPSSTSNAEIILSTALSIACPSPILSAVSLAWAGRGSIPRPPVSAPPAQRLASAALISRS